MTNTGIRNGFTVKNAGTGSNHSHLKGKNMPTLIEILNNFACLVRAILVGFAILAVTFPIVIGLVVIQVPLPLAALMWLTISFFVWIND